MNRKVKRTFSLVGATTAGLIGVTALTGAGYASASTTTDRDNAAKTSVSAPATLATPGRAADQRAGNLPAWAHGSRAAYRAGLAVQAKYPKATITDVTRTDDGWKVSVTVDGRSGDVLVSSDLSVGRLVVQHRR